MKLYKCVCVCLSFYNNTGLLCKNNDLPSRLSIFNISSYIMYHTHTIYIYIYNNNNNNTTYKFQV